MSKTTEFRNGQKMEVGFDLKKDHTGKANGTPMSTAAGELISNFLEQGDYLKTQPPSPQE